MRSFAVLTLFIAPFSSLLQVHATLPGDGTYTIQSVEFLSQYLNLRGGSDQEGTHIMGYNDTLSLASQWVFTNKGDRLVTLRNVQSGTFIDTTDVKEDADAIGSQTPGIFKIWEIDQDEYQLTLVNEFFALYLMGGKNGRRVVVKAADKEDANQVWKFHRVLGA